MYINKQLIIDSINNCTSIEETIQNEIDTIIDNAYDDIKDIEQKYNIKIYINYEWWNE